MSAPPLPAALLAALVALLVPAAARADAVSDAKDLFERGRELRGHGDCAGAVPVFRQAYELYPDGLGSERNLAECEESLGHFASARRAWLELKRALLTHPDAKYAGWSQDADEAAARLAPKLASLTIDLRVIGAAGNTVTAGGVRVTLDGEPLAASLMGTALERDPGRHIVQVSGEGVSAQERTIDLVAGDAKHVPLRVQLPARPEESTANAQPPNVAIADEGERPGATRRTVSWIVIGIGAASLVGAGVSLAVRQSALSDLQRACPGYSGCASTLQPTVSRGQTASTLVTALGVTGAVATTAGIVLLLTGPRGETRAELVVTPTIGGAAASWSF